MTGKRKTALVLVVLVIIVGLSALVVRIGTVQKRPNIIIILSDTLRRDHLGCYGYKRDTSPNIDEFAKDATIFQNAFAQSPSTKPSVTSLFTSLYPSQHNVILNQHALNLSHTTLAEALGQNGYVTAAFIENPVLFPKFGFDQGFLTYVTDDRRHKKTTESMEEFDRKLQSWLEENSKETFFLYIHFIDPHGPYMAPPPYGDFFDPDYTGEIKGYEFSKEHKKHFYRNRRDLEHLVALYDDEIRYIDSRCGEIIRQLTKLNILDKSIVILIADHGEEFLEHGGLQHSNSVYSELINIPLIIRHPESFTPGRVEPYAQQIDIFPTLMGILGIDTEMLPLEGNDLLAESREQAAAQTAPIAIISEHLRRGWGTPQRCVIMEDWKLVHTLDSDTYGLYNLIEDPVDSTDVLESNPDIADLLKSYFAVWLRDRHPGTDADEVFLDDDIKEKLRALGYIK